MFQTAREKDHKAGITATETGFTFGKQWCGFWSQNTGQILQFFRVYLRM